VGWRGSVFGRTLQSQKPAAEGSLAAQPFLTAVRAVRTASGGSKRRLQNDTAAGRRRESMKLIVYYTVLSSIGDVIAAIVCLGIEKVVPWISMPIFLALFFLILWAAWVAAVKMTEPKDISAPIAGATSDQRA
jgi:hypothetical protein